MTETFSTYSKPKILACSNNINNYDQSNIEVIKVEEIKNEVINYLNPDLIITDKNATKEKELLGNNINIGRKWLELPEKSNIGLHESAVLCSLTKHNDLISIFTPVFNIKEKILKTYESLVSQTYSNWEWVLIDDSNDFDQTYTILKTISNNDSRVKVYKFRENSRGCIGEVKYRAAMLCNGEYLVELDHDDYLTFDCLELLVKGYRENPECGFVYSDAAEVDRFGNSNQYPDGFAMGYGKHYETTYKGKLYYPSVAPPLNPVTIRHIVSVPNHIRSWRASVYHDLRGHNRQMRIADDYELIVRTFLKTKWLHIPKMLYIQNFDGENSQDKGGNRADIQIRVREISEFYSDKIKQRFDELGGFDFCYKIPIPDLYGIRFDPNTPSFHKTMNI